VTDQALHECLQIGVSALENSASAVDVVEKVVSMAALNGHDGSFLFLPLQLSHIDRPMSPIFL
jgi:hypothetical protein